MSANTSKLGNASTTLTSLNTSWSAVLWMWRLAVESTYESSTKCSFCLLKFLCRLEMHKCDKHKETILLWNHHQMTKRESVPEKRECTKLKGLPWIHVLVLLCLKAPTTVDSRGMKGFYLTPLPNSLYLCPVLKWIKRKAHTGRSCKTTKRNLTCSQAVSNINLHAVEW